VRGSICFGFIYSPSLRIGTITDSILIQNYQQKSKRQIKYI
jgi:hypothetical protein